MPGQVPPALRKERNAQVRAALGEAARAYQLGFLGQKLPVLWESAIKLGPDNWQMSGWTDNYLRVQAETPRQMWNRITPVVLEGIEAEGICGRVVNG